MNNSLSYWQLIWQQFKQHRLGVMGLLVIILFCLTGIYAPFLASSKPLVVYFEGEWYFPLFRYLFYRGFFTKRLDLFYNLLIFTLPLFIFLFWSLKRYPKIRSFALLSLLLFHLFLFLYVAYRTPQDPASDLHLVHARQQRIQALAKSQRDPLLAPSSLPSWEDDLNDMNGYAKLNLVLRYQQRKEQHERLSIYQDDYAQEAKRKKRADLTIPSLWHLEERREKEELERLQQVLENNQARYSKDKSLIDALKTHCRHTQTAPNLSPAMACEFLAKLSQKDTEAFIKAKQTVDHYEFAEAKIRYLQDRKAWLEKKVSELRYEVMPLLRPFHWEDDAGGEQMLNHYISWWDLTRINRKDMVAALIFGVRISLSVGLLSVALALLIGIPIGAIAGFYGGTADIIIYRLIEIWESMPTFFMLLMVVAFLQSKSIFLVMGVIGLFGWTNFSRYIRGEFFKQKQLPYVEACRSLGFDNGRIMYSHLLPNAIPPLLTLVPFSIMGAISSEAGLSFLGLGEEGSCSWGVLMDEGRRAFPSESYLLWPPAILLTILLVAIALVGDALRDALDPKLRR
jgi:peptide/nickel transport system permease protein